MDRWYYARQKQKFGPVSSAQLRQLAATGQLLPSDMVLMEGTQKWSTAGSIPSLYGKVEEAANPVGSRTSTTPRSHESTASSPAKSQPHATHRQRIVSGQWPWMAGAGAAIVFLVALGIWLTSDGGQERATPGISDRAQVVTAPHPSGDAPTSIPVKTEQDANKQADNSGAKEPAGVKNSIPLPAPKSPDAVGELLAKLKNADVSTAKSIIVDLGNLGPSARDAVDALELQLFGPNWQEAAKSLGQIGPGARKAVPSLVIVFHKRLDYSRLAGILDEIDAAAAKQVRRLIQIGNEVSIAEANRELLKVRYESEKLSGITPERTRELLGEVAKLSQALSMLSTEKLNIYNGLAGGTNQPKNTGSPTEREKLLAQWQKKKEETLRGLEENHQKLEQRMESVRKQVDAILQDPRWDPANKQMASRYNDLVKEEKAIRADLKNPQQSLQDRIAKASVAAEMERRKIIAQFPLPGDPTYTEYKGLLYTLAELEQHQAYEKDHLTPRAVADAYLRAASNQGLVRQPVFAGLFRNPKSPDTLAVAFKVSSVKGKQVMGNTVHVFVYQDNWQFWQVSQVAADGVNILLGAPPTGYVPAPE